MIDIRYAKISDKKNSGSVWMGTCLKMNMKILRGSGGDIFYCRMANLRDC